MVNLVGLGRKPDEDYQAYKTRIRDQLGIIVDEKALMEAAFEAAKAQAETDIIFAGHENTAGILSIAFRFDLSGILVIDLDADDQNLLRYDFQRLLALRKNPPMKRLWVDGLIPPDVLELLETHTRNQFKNSWVQRNTVSKSCPKSEISEPW